MEILNKISKHKKTPLELLKQGLQNVNNKYLNNKCEVWDSMYDAHYEDKMNSNAQKDRYLEIINIIYNSGINKPEILDIGSGNGTLTKYLEEKQFKTYTGIDTSKEAVKIANNYFENYDNVCFLETDILTFSGYKFDFIIFNESLYYFKLSDIKRVLTKALALLKDEGFIIISMSVNLKSYMIRKILDKLIKPETDKIVLSRHSKNKWKIRVYKNLKSVE